jgi:RNA polymerase sigma-70 factor (ECF subfamily)
MLATSVARLGGGVAPPRVVETQAWPTQRDPDRFAALYEQHVDRIRSHVRGRVGDADLADDLSSQVFLRAWQAIERYRPVPGRPFIAWLYAIANNLIVDHYRRSRRELVGVKGDPRDSGHADPERCALTGDLREEIRRALARLKPEQQLIVSLRLVEGREYEEIAAITGKSTGALRVALCRALTSLRDELRRRGVQPA